MVDYISMYRDYNRMQDFIKTTDEDDFPTFVEALNKIYGDSLSRKATLMNSSDKIVPQNVEHAALSIVALLGSDIGQDIALYECSKTNPAKLPDSEIKTLLQFVRGFLFFQKKLLYISEKEFSDNINWLNKNPNVDLEYTRAFFKWRSMDNEQSHIAFHSMNHLFRGFDRLIMDRKTDDEHGLEDFEAFLEDSRKLGVQNEIVWAVESYLYIKKEDNKKAIHALQKLRSSQLLSETDKKTIDDSVIFLGKRQPGEKLNGIYDKYFLGKIASKYMLSTLAQIDWKAVLERNNVAHAEQIMGTIDNLKKLSENLKIYSNPAMIKDKGKGFLDKVKNF